MISLVVLKLLHLRLMLKDIELHMTNSMAYGTQRFNAAFTRTLQ